MEPGVASSQHVRGKANTATLHVRISKCPRGAVYLVSCLYLCRLRRFCLQCSAACTMIHRRIFKILLGDLRILFKITYVGIIFLKYDALVCHLELQLAAH